MVRSLWSAASGMIAQQTNIDTIAHNLSNVNTTGYKTEVAEFKSLLYQTLQTRTTTKNGEEKPVAAQVGLGTRTTSIAAQFSQGSFQDTESNTDFAISGKGFYCVQGPNGKKLYTRNGNFFLNTNAEGGLTLCTSEGYPVLNTQGNEIKFGSQYNTSKLICGSGGEFYYPDAKGVPQPIPNMIIGLYQFNNPTGLDKAGGSFYTESVASGPALNEATNNNVEKSEIVQGYLEMSNVQIVDEMVEMIIAQRAYEINAKAVTTSDEMLQTANNLKR